MSAADHIHLDVALVAHPKVIVTLERTPSGAAVTTAYYDAEGALARQDCHLIIDPAPAEGVAATV
jgi:hypothetical protein